MKFIVAPFVAFLAAGLTTCDNFTFDLSPSRTIVISESTVETADMHLSDIGPNDFMLLALLRDVGSDWAQNLQLADLTQTAFTIGRIENKKFERKLVNFNLDYWTGSGSYWIAFVMADGQMKYINLGYLSKQPVHISAKNPITYLTNLDFAGNVEMKIDISDLPTTPFGE
ncbi:MAG: hypothetical protein LBC72_00985 [Spirochaetaceae bacterium]|jgi:hypothetical protein|nr:hypothetical protein [Spirochaetaceae bacterium]